MTELNNIIEMDARTLKLRTAKNSDLKNEWFLSEIFRDLDDKDTQNYKLKVEEIARDRKIWSEVSPLLEQITRKVTVEDIQIFDFMEKHDLVPDSRGYPENCLENIYTILLNDPDFNNLYKNAINDRWEWLPKDWSLKQWKGFERSKVVPWDRGDSAKIARLIQKKYKMKNVIRNVRDELKEIGGRERKYHPIKRLIEAEPVNSESRKCEEFFIKWLKIEDTPINREISRLLFACGINRLYNPGCSAPFTFVFISTTQGTGKSLITECLALEKQYHYTLEGLDTKELEKWLASTWIVELSEMEILEKGTAEAVKRFLTQDIANFREAYDENYQQNERVNLFLGTTNRESFVKDKSGARRFLPLYPQNTSEEGTALGDIKDEIAREARYCWAEAKARMDKGEMPMTYPLEMAEEIRKLQKSLMVADELEGMIGKFLDETASDKVCTMDIWIYVLGRDRKKQIPYSQSRRITQIMDNKFKAEWEYQRNKTHRFREWGAQRYWLRKSNNPTTVRN